MTGEYSLPQRGILIEHVVTSLDLYWATNSSLIKNLPIFDVSEALHFSLPLRVYEVELPEWASHLGENGKICVPQDLVKNFTGTAKNNIWRNIDWFSAIFLMLECWHERIWEKKHGPIHSYSFRLKGWDPRVWDHPWVNHIAMFLREWAAKLQNRPCIELFGYLSSAKVTMTHDVDAFRKTVAIRIKQTLFNIFNFFNSILRGRLHEAAKFIKQALRFLFFSENWNRFDILLQIEKMAGLQAVFNFYSKYEKTSLKTWLLDPSYSLEDADVCQVISQIRQAGHIIGFHPGYDSWNNTDLFSEQKEKLERQLNVDIVSCRQHWLRFSWSCTWSVQQKNGIEFDTTLMFNDRPGFRNSSTICWRPWCMSSGSQHKIKAVPTILMDSHLYDYKQFTDEGRSLEIQKWINSIFLVNGHACVLWHPHTLADSYGWIDGFKEVVTCIKKGKKTNAN